MMKKNILFSLRSFVAGAALAVVGTTAYGQVLFNQDFSTASVTTPPAGWVNIDNVATGDVWEFNNPAGRIITGGTPGFSGQFAIIDSDNYGNGSFQDVDLETPTFNASLGGSYILEFDNNWEQCCGAVGTVQIWNGTTWTTVLTLPNSGDGDGDEDPSTHENINITTAVGTSASAKVRFHYEGDWDYWWALDNIKVTRLSCTAPSASFTIVPNCASNEFSVSVNISSLGSATSVAITEGSTTFATASTIGTFTAGPFASGTNHTIVLEHNLDALCNTQSPVQIYVCPATNNECTSARNLISSAICNPITANTISATASSTLPSCSFLQDGDVWFSFVAIATAHKVTVNNPIASNAEFYAYGAAAYSGTCTGLSQIGCGIGSDFLGITPAEFIITGLTVGSTYFVQVWEDEAYDNNFDPISTDLTFDICVSEVPSAPACVANIAPANAMTDLELSPVNPSFSWNAEPSADEYEFYLGTTAASAVSLGTTSGTTISVSDLDFATTYYWYVVPTNDGGDAVGCDANAFSFTTVGPTPPANDECTGAIAINANSGIVAVSNLNATASDIPSTCNSTTAITTSDIWYSVTADFTGDIDIEVDQNNIDAVIDVYSGVCGTLTNLDCADGSFITISATAGETYYIRLDGWLAEQANFAIQLTGTALPVKMDNLAGKIVAGNLAQLSWNTFSEQNNKGFEVQSSADAKNFKTIGFVVSNAKSGNSTEKIGYTFTDKNSLNGTAYYRVQQVDIDGKTAVSNVVRLSTKQDGTFAVVAAPNPVKNMISVSTLGVQGSNATLHIADLTGKIIKTICVTGAETIVDMAEFAAGIYLIKYTDSEHTQTIKVNKQ